MTLHPRTGEANFRLPGPSNRIAIVLCTAAVCLLMLHYLKFDSAFVGFLELIDQLAGKPVNSTRARLQETGFVQLLAYAWWGFWHLLAYAIVPVVVIKLVLRDSLKDYGLSIAGLRNHWGWYLALTLPIVGFAIGASFRADFASHYPFYTLAARSWFDLLSWEAIYLFQFVCLEFFFRGFVLFGCRPLFGDNAVWVMALPYLMIHFSKPWPEAAGALIFGVILGFLALKSRSIWGGVLVHITIAATMDLAAIVQNSGLPERLFIND